MLRVIILMLHSVVKAIAERETDHNLLTRGLDLYEVDHDGETAHTLYAKEYKKARKYIVALMQVAFQGQTKVKNRGEYYMMWLQRYELTHDTIGRAELSNVTWNSGSRNFDTFSDDNTNRGKRVTLLDVKLSEARRYVQEHKQVRGYKRVNLTDKQLCERSINGTPRSEQASVIDTRKRQGPEPLVKWSGHRVYITD